LNGIEKRVFLEKNRAFSFFHFSYLLLERENQMLKEIIANFTNNLEAQIEPLFQNLLSSQDFYSLIKRSGMFLVERDGGIHAVFKRPSVVRSMGNDV
jgi:hypothetical protein